MLQGSGMVLLLTLALIDCPDALPVRWGLVVAGYAVAKLLEWQDHAIWDLTGQLVSGHALKHVVAALAVLPVFATWKPAPRRHNEAHRLPQGA